MATSYYSTGTVSLTNGSAVVTGIGTGWQLALISGGNVIVQAPGNLLPIASVDSDTQITAELEWTGATGTYAYTIQRDTAYLQSLDQNSQNLSYLLSELRAGTIFKYDQSGDLAGRDLYDARPKNFGYLVTIGVSQPEFYVKASNADGDWAGPFPYGTGPVGPAPTLGIGTVTTLSPGAAATASVSGADGDYDLNLGIPAGLTGITLRGTYSGATAYAERDGVLYNGSTWQAKQATTANAPPSLPTTENAYWRLIAAKGLDGDGAGDMVAATYDPQNKQRDVFAEIVETSEMFRGFGYANNAGSDPALIDIAPGICRDALNEVTINLSSTITKNVSYLWAPGNGGGGWDYTPGPTVPNGFHWIHAIWNPTTETADILFSASIGAPVMPAGFTHRRLIGGLAYATYSVFPFINEGEWHYYKTRFASVSGISIGTTTQDILLSVPLGAKLEVQTQFTIYNSAGATASAVTVRDPDLGPFTASADTSVWYQPPGLAFASQGILRTNTVGKVRVGSSSETTMFTLKTDGWRIDRSVYR